MTPPISTAVPTQREIEVTESLKQELVRRNSYESQEESKLRHVLVAQAPISRITNSIGCYLCREITLGRVAVLVRKFVHDVMIERGFCEAMASTAGGKIFTFGSYRLGVHGPGTDIDTLCVVPKHIERDDFFAHFEPMLRAFEGATDVAVRFSIRPLLVFVSSDALVPRVFRRHMSQSSLPIYRE